MPAARKLVERLIPALQAACVLASAWLVWRHNVLPRLGFQSLSSILFEAMSYVSLAWIAGAFIAFWVYLVIALAEAGEASRFSLRAASPAMWFVPAIVLLSVPVPGAFAASFFLIFAATRQLIANWPGFNASAARGSPMVAPFAVAGAAQAGVVEWLWHQPVGAAGFLALATAVLTSLAITSGAYRPDKPPALPHSALSIALTFLLSVSLTFNGIAVGRGGWGNSADGSGSPSGQPSPAPEVPALPDEGAGFGGDFPGVILLPELKPYTTIFTPSPVAPASSRLMAPAPKPLDIPFSGEYWLYRRPASRPPRHSTIRRGSALDLSFHTTDGWPMEMEAHQKLDAPVSTACCREIRIVIRSADQHPELVSLELILRDTVEFPRRQSLGLAVPGPPAASPQTLTFQVPASPVIRQFDELEIVFHRAPWRMDKSVRIAIDRLILVP